MPPRTPWRIPPDGDSMRLVRDDEVAAGELARHFPTVSRPAVSQHLRVLARADLVTVRRDGTGASTAATRTDSAELRSFIDDMWTDRLARLKRVAEQAHAEDRR